MTTSDWITLGAAILTGGGTLFLGIMAWRTIQQTRSIQKREHKERLLNEIIEWAKDIQTVTLDVDIPLADKRTSAAMTRNIELNILRRLGITFMKNDYIRAIASKTFKKDLQTDVEEVIETFTVFLFFKQLSIGVEKPKSAFRGKALAIMEKTEEQIKKGNKTVEQLLEECIDKKAILINGLLVKVGNLLSS